MSSNNPLAQKTLQFVTISGVFAKKAIDEVNEHRKAADAAREKSPEILSHLKASNVIDEDQEKLAEEMLSSHSQTLDLLKSAVDALAEARRALAVKEAMDNGDAAADPNGNGSSDSSLHGPYVGQRTSVKKASDLALERGLLGAT